jgi:hypothetical protein
MANDHFRRKKMNSIKFVGCIAAIILLIAFIMPVSAGSHYGYSSAGSTYDGGGLSLTSGLSSSSVGSTGNPFLGYSINVKGIGQNPTIGDMSTFGTYSSQTTGQKISFSDSTSASGYIYQFTKVYSFS